MKEEITIFNRKRGKQEKEKVFFKKGLELFYGSGFISRILYLFLKFSILSKVFGFIQKRRFSKKRIFSFVKKYKIDLSDFENISSFESFNDFFIRRLKPGRREIDRRENRAVAPCDGRYLFFPNVGGFKYFYVKGKRFDLGSFLQDPNLASKYQDGSMVIARLSPVDYHRFHFPLDCMAGEARLINGALHSVNPIAIGNNLAIFWENKRMVTILKSKIFGEVLFVEVGATNVGSINQTYEADRFYKKGDEKGYFSLGGSSIVMLFKRGILAFDSDLLDIINMEIKLDMGESMGRAL